MWASTAQIFPLISVVMLAVKIFLHQTGGWKEHADLDMLAVNVVAQYTVQFANICAYIDKCIGNKSFIQSSVSNNKTWSIRVSFKLVVWTFVKWYEAISKLSIKPSLNVLGHLPVNSSVQQHIGERTNTSEIVSFKAKVNVMIHQHEN